MLIDSHCHLNFPDLVNRLPEVLANMAAADVRQALENADRSYFTKIHHHVLHSDALAYCIGQAQNAVGNAVAALADLPDNDTTRAMRELAELSVARLS